MREIKFRAWDTKDSKFLDNDDWYISMNWKFCLICWHVTCDYCWENVDDSIGYNDYDYLVKTGLITLQQFTGLFDKNGKEIYEWDIMSNYWWCVVEWRDYKYDFLYKHPNFSTKQWMWWMDNYFCKNEIEIIGNIHENPELLSN